MVEWQLLDDLVIFEGLRLRLHRIARSHWRANDVLRSWGAVPLHREGDALHAPCADDEALWLGAWLADDMTAIASVALTDAESGFGTTITPPGSFQIAGLYGPDGASHPIEGANTTLSLKLRCGLANGAASLLLDKPSDWAVLAGRPAPENLSGPPPLPPRLG